MSKATWDPEFTPSYTPMEMLDNNGPLEDLERSRSMFHTAYQEMGIAPPASVEVHGE